MHSKLQQLRVIPFKVAYIDAMKKTTTRQKITEGKTHLRSLKTSSFYEESTYMKYPDKTKQNSLLHQQMPQIFARY